MSASGPQRAGREALELYPKLGVFYEQITGDEDARVCKDIPESACRHLPRNFFAYLVSNFLTKVADELESEGVDKFVQAFDELFEVIAGLVQRLRA